MTYEDRIKHRDLVERLTRLRERIQEGEDSSALTRAEAGELVAIVEETVANSSPERLDRIMETVVDEATLRAGAFSLSE
jgi:hypothetical protein